MAGKDHRQALLRQARPVAQAFPHVPQLRASMEVSVQVEPHSCRGAMQPLTAAHTPSLQYWPIAHALLQAPQCFGSFFASTQAMPH